MIGRLKADHDRLSEGGACAAFPKMMLWPLTHFVIADTSMQPALRPGDRVFVWRPARPKPGDVVVVRDPEARSTFLIKRVTAASDAGLTVAGDNPNVSRDSRHFGPVP